MGKRIHIVLASLILLAATASAQSVNLSVDSLGDALNLSYLSWKYHPGDNLEWADSSFDDSGWELLPISTDPDSIDSWTGIGWFRMTLLVDSTLQNETIAFSAYQVGASELYLNGELIHRYGWIGSNAQTDTIATPKGVPRSLALGDGSEQVLAIRFAGRAADSYFNRWYSPPEESLPQGYHLFLAPLDLRIAQHSFTAVAVWGQGLIVGVFLLMFILHGSLYLLDRSDRANLALSLFAGIEFIGLQTHLFIMSGTYVGEIEFWQLVFTGSSLYVMIPLIVWAIHLTFYNRLLTYGKVLIGLQVVAVVVFISVGRVEDDSLLETAAIALSILQLLETIRVPAIQIWKRTPGAWIFGIGAGIMLGRVVLNVIQGIDALSFGQLATRPELLDVDGYITLLVFLPIPISASIFLAQKFARNNLNLKANIVEVERLSEETKAQQEERQKLIERQNEQLEITVAERTADLNQTLENLRATQAQLVEQEKLASLGSLTAGIAHEIKNPLNFVNNFAEVGGEMADELREAVVAGRSEEVLVIIAELKANSEQITKHGRRADDIVKAMMQHARGGSSEMETVELNSFLEEYANLAWHGRRAKVGDFQAELVRDFSAEVGSLKAMPQELGRVILNLLNNAFDAVKDIEGAKVSIATRRDASGVHISVSDNGPGIPEAIRDKIFEPFFTTKPTGEGTGLGLSLSYDIITKGHGGTMTAESNRPNGATFVIIIPA